MTNFNTKVAIKTEHVQYTELHLYILFKARIKTTRFELIRIMETSATNLCLRYE